MKTKIAQGSPEILMSLIPSYYILPNLIDTTASTNIFQVYVNNDGNGARRISNVLIELPAEFTNFKVINSKGILSGMPTNLLLEYDDKTSIYAGDYDLFTISLEDNYEIGTLTRLMNCRVADEFGYVPMKLKSGFQYA